MVLVTLAVIALIGAILSVYVIYVATQSEKDPKYKAICDISEKISCSIAHSSKWGHIFDISTGYFAAPFYGLIFILALLELRLFIFPLAVFSVLYSIYFAYILVFKVKTLCLVCVSLYIVNVLLLIFSWSLSDFLAVII